MLNSDCALKWTVADAWFRDDVCDFTASGKFQGTGDARSGQKLSSNLPSTAQCPREQSRKESRGRTQTKSPSSSFERETVDGTDF